MTTPDAGLSVEVGPPLAADQQLGGDGTFGGILLDLAERFGARTALVTTAGRWTYGELADCAMTVARVSWPPECNPLTGSACCCRTASNG